MVAFTNPFRITNAPDHMVAERRLRHRHILHTVLLMLALTALGTYAAPLIVWLIRQRVGFGSQALHLAEDYFAQLWGPDPWRAHRVLLNDPRFLPTYLSMFPTLRTPFTRGVMVYGAVGAIALFVGALRHFTNPYERMVMKQEASWCDEATLRRMERRGYIGIRTGKLLSIGRWQTGLRAGQDIKAVESLSALCVAPPGSGKTAGFVVPAIVSSPEVSLLVNDRKPELHEMTGHYRASIGHVIVMDWSKMDSHEIALDPVTSRPILDERGRPRMIHTLWPRWNPLSPKLMPPPGPNRDTYISTVATALLPDKQVGASTDDYFTPKGRDALGGFLHAIVARVNDRQEADPIRYQGIPKHWHGKEASLGMLVDWIAYSQFMATAKAEYDDMPGEEAGDGGDDEKDKIGAWLRSLCDEINPESRESGDSRGTTARGFGALSQLVNMADRERSGVLGTVDKGLLPFKNESVKQRTEASDFTPDDMRGILGDDGIWRPVTVYVCVNQAEADAFATVTALFFEVMSRWLLTYKPNDWNSRTNRQLGPFIVGFILDEFAKMPPIPAVLEGPDTGRGMGVFYLLVMQDYAQVEKMYSEPNTRTLDTVTAFKFILPQNEVRTINRIIEMVGKTTIRRASHSFSEGMGQGASPFKWNRNDTSEETDLLRKEEIVAMPQGTHIVIVQGFNNRPMRLTTNLFFNDPELNARVRSRGKGPVATEILPRHVRRERIKAYNDELDKIDRMVDERYEASKSKSITVSRELIDLP